MRLEFKICSVLWNLCHFVNLISFHLLIKEFSTSCYQVVIYEVISLVSIWTCPTEPSVLLLRLLLGLQISFWRINWSQTFNLLVCMCEIQQESNISSLSFTLFWWQQSCLLLIQLFLAFISSPLGLVRGKQPNFLSWRGVLHQLDYGGWLACFVFRLFSSVSPWCWYCQRNSTIICLMWDSSVLVADALANG